MSGLLPGRRVGLLEVPARELREDGVPQLLGQGLELELELGLELGPDGDGDGNCEGCVDRFPEARVVKPMICGPPAAEAVLWILSPSQPEGLVHECGKVWDRGGGCQFTHRFASGVRR